MNEAYWPPPLNASAVTSHPVSILLFSCQRAHGRTRRSAATHSYFGTPCAPKPSTLSCLARYAKQRTVHVAQDNVHYSSYLCVHDAPLHGDSWPHELRTRTVYSQEKCRSRKTALKMGCKFLHHYNRGARLCAFGTYGSPAWIYHLISLLIFDGVIGFPFNEFHNAILNTNRIRNHNISLLFRIIGHSAIHVILSIFFFHLFFFHLFIFHLFWV